MELAMIILLTKRTQRKVNTEESESARGESEEKNERKYERRERKNLIVLI